MNKKSTKYLFHYTLQKCRNLFAKCYKWFERLHNAQIPQDFKSAGSF